MGDAGTPAIGGHEPRAVQKALQLLEAVARLGPGTTAREIADWCRVPRSTAYRLLNLLVGDGYLVRVDDLAGFALGRRARELAAPAPDQAQPGPAAVAEVAEDLRRKIRHGVHLVSLSGAEPSWADPDPDHEVAADDPMLRAWHASAVGKILLADRPELLTGQQLARFTPYTITDWPRLLAELGDVRNSGLAVDREESVVGRVGLAAAVRSGTGRVTGCLLIAGRSGRLSPDAPELVEPVLAGARRLSGWPG
ncbi:IclR family transcriptional regulator [Microlunatus sp. GCM10028923]|uniref:IclR family transcriptional regulator n=1 Tax=Microlunatus sp. GCM10028923 TaxID=3273400 RepID=UPI003610E65B